MAITENGTATFDLTVEKAQLFLTFAQAQLERIGGIETDTAEAEELRDTIGGLQRHLEYEANEDVPFGYMLAQVLTHGKHIYDGGVAIDELAEDAAEHFAIPLTEGLREEAAEVWHRYESLQ